MTAAQEEDARERWIIQLRKEIEKILPYPTSSNQRAAFDQAIHLNLTGMGRNA